MQKLANEKIGQFAQRLILSTNLTNTEILQHVKVQFPDAKTTLGCIAWYQNDLKKKKVVKAVTVELLDEEIKELQAKIEALEFKKLELIEEANQKLINQKQELLMQLEAIQALEAQAEEA